jgi:fatty acid desaturase
MNMIKSGFRAALSKNRSILIWSHLFLVIILIFFIPLSLNLFRAHLNIAIVASGFIFTLIGHCQNIGLVHEFSHRLPPGPRPIGLWTAKFFHAFGGLKYEHASTAHHFHHKYLGTERDPDRLGYLTTSTLFKRIVYLFLIGPLRAKFAPVDLETALNDLSDSQKLEHYRRVKQDRILLVVTQLALILVLGRFIFFYWTSLILANVLSNVREMTEHGDNGSAAYVIIRPSLTGILFFSTPGFWYHGIHHMHPHIPYWSLPAANLHPQLKMLNDLPLFKRKSYLKYFIFGS